MSVWRGLPSGELDVAAGHQAAADFSMSGASAALEEADRLLSAALWLGIVVAAVWISWKCFAAARCVYISSRSITSRLPHQPAGKRVGRLRH